SAAFAQWLQNRARQRARRIASPASAPSAEVLHEYEVGLKTVDFVPIRQMFRSNRVRRYARRAGCPCVGREIAGSVAPSCSSPGGGGGLRSGASTGSRHRVCSI